MYSSRPFRGLISAAGLVAALAIVPALASEVSADPGPPTPHLVRAGASMSGMSGRGPGEKPKGIVRQTRAPATRRPARRAMRPAAPGPGRAPFPGSRAGRGAN
jgi:hypothetical protein